jgi:hypothetical protein
MPGIAAPPAPERDDLAPPGYRRRLPSRTSMVRSCPPRRRVVDRGGSASPAPPGPTRARRSARHILVAYQGAMRSTATRSEGRGADCRDEGPEAVKAPGADFAAVSHQYSDDKVSGRPGRLPRHLRRRRHDARVPEGGRGPEGRRDLPGLVETLLGFHVIQRLSMADAVGILRRETAVLTGRFPWRASRAPRAPRARRRARSPTHRRPRRRCSRASASRTCRSRSRPRRSSSRSGCPRPCGGA